jgi:hypothetical protein
MNTILFTLADSMSKVKADLPHADTSSAQISNILSVVFGVLGAIALLMIVISGLRYITSAGDPQKASKAKDGIIYALVGLMLALFAQGIVVFIVNRT